jgi:hypothetical protein
MNSERSAGAEKKGTPEDAPLTTYLLLIANNANSMVGFADTTAVPSIN